MGAPLLPLSPREGAALAAATAAAVAAWQPRQDTARLPRVPERVLVALVTILRGEHADHPRSSRVARTRVRRLSALTGAVGPLGLIPTEVIGLVEQARAAVDAAATLPEPRSDEQLAADLLCAWDVLEDRAEAESLTSGADDRSLLDALVAHGGAYLRDQVPERWTPWSTLKLLWQLRQLPGLRGRLTVSSLRSRGLRAVPVLGAVPSAFSAHREMRAFQDRLETLYAAPSPGA